MKAYVINQQQLGQSIAAVAVALIISFSLGYFAGSATGENETESHIENNTLNAADPVESPAGDDEAAEKKTKVEAKQPGDKNKKSGTEDVKEKKSENTASSPTKPAASPQPETASRAKKSTVEKQSVVKKVSPEKVVSKPVAPVKSAKSVVSTPEVKPASNRDAISTDNRPQKTDSSSASRAYSIQAGMFASKNNAQSFVEKLSAEKFEAYVTDFVSSDGAVKYNVRVGRYEERDIAREKLKEYQKFFSTPAYVVIAQ